MRADLNNGEIFSGGVFEMARKGRSDARKSRVTQKSEGVFGRPGRSDSAVVKASADSAPASASLFIGIKVKWVALESEYRGQAMIGPGRGRASAIVTIASRALALSLAALLSFVAPGALAQSNQCELTPDERNPTEKVLRCGATLVVHAAPGTSYRAEQAPRSLQLDDGALMIEFRPSHAQRTFQILTPHAMVAVRGTKWAVEVAPQRSSALVIAGKVSVSRLAAPGGVILRPGEGADVDSDASSPLVVKRWAEKRVRALLARFGE